MAYVGDSIPTDDLVVPEGIDRRIERRFSRDAKVRGRLFRKYVGLFVAVVCVALFALLPWSLAANSLGWIYEGAVAVVGVLLIYEHAIVRPDDLTRVNTAFFNVNVVISVGLFIVGTIDLLWR